ncbi:MAG TPA: methylmalonyl-CoA mutase family protein [Candidatus Wallbacteria bacterium]|nr:methylmalonyl-CoA mutase family protein [Candidatus Wallbacteria bacterium]
MSKHHDSQGEGSNDIKNRSKEWHEKVYTKSISKFPERMSTFKNSSGGVIDPLYNPADLENNNYMNDIGFPGEFPFTRGVQPNMYRGRFWTMRQYAGFGTAEESNKRYKYLLGQGQTGLSIAFDLPTQIGYDSDHALASGEVGKVGVAIDTLADMEMLFNGIPLNKVSTSMTINAPASVLLAMYIAVGEKQGHSRAELEGTIQNDILKEYIARGTYIFPPKPSLRLITDIFDFCTREVPKWNTISISGYHIREAGSTAAQEVGFTIADAICYVDAAIKKGLKLDDFAARLSFFFNAHNDILEEVSKFRAARRLWARIMKDRFGAKEKKSMMLRFHTQTAGSTLTAQQPDNNIMRVAYQALSAVLGGTQSLHTNSRDEALALPTQDSVTIALRTQQVLAYESGVADSVDPLAGSYYIEASTDRIEREAMEYIKKIDEMGGMIAAIEAGYVQKNIQEASYNYMQSIEKQEKIIVGVNKFELKEEAAVPLMRVDPIIEKNQTEKLNKIRATRNNEKVKENLEKLRNAAQSDVNLMPVIIDCVREYASLGEICDTMRRVFGEHKENVVI